MTPSIDAVRSALAQVNDPVLERSIVDLGIVHDLKVDDGYVAFTLDLRAIGDAGPARRQRLGTDARASVEKLPGVLGVEIRWQDDVAGRTIAGDDPLPGVRNII